MLLFYYIFWRWLNKKEDPKGENIYIYSFIRYPFLYISTPRQNVANLEDIEIPKHKILQGYMNFFESLKEVMILERYEVFIREFEYNFFQLENVYEIIF